jgi:hypothetical protein
MLTHRENFLRNARFQGPEWIPMNIGISDASWDLFREDLEHVCLRFPEYFPYVKTGWRDYEHHRFSNAFRGGESFRMPGGSSGKRP